MICHHLHDDRPLLSDRCYWFSWCSDRSIDRSEFLLTFILSFFGAFLLHGLDYHTRELHASIRSFSDLCLGVLVDLGRAPAAIAAVGAYCACRPRPIGLRSRPSEPVYGASHIFDLIEPMEQGEAQRHAVMALPCRTAIDMGEEL